MPFTAGGTCRRCGLALSDPNEPAEAAEQPAPGERADLDAIRAAARKALCRR